MHILSHPRRVALIAGDKKLAVRCWVFASLVSLATALGCQQRASTPGDALRQLDPQLLVPRGQIQFVTDARAGCQLAQRQGLPCLLFFTAEWCTYCHHMEETAFIDSKVGNLAKHFVCVLVDADREPDLCRYYGVRGYPTVQFLSADGRKLHRLVGRQSTPQLTAGMQAALERLAWLDDAVRDRR